LKLLFDHNLSHRIVPLIADLFECEHVRHLGLARETPDEAIYDFAKRHGYTIVTANRDFLNLASLYGAPPQVIRLEAMDYQTEAAATLIRKFAVAIVQFGQSSRATLILRKEG
jgi:predicted nuclease of predicted toxin-antitoxin system